MIPVSKPTLFLDQFCRKILNRFSVPKALFDFDRFHVFSVPIIESNPGNIPEIDAGEIDADDSADVAACRQIDNPDAIHTLLVGRLESGCVGVGLRQGEDLIAYAWASIGFNLQEDVDSYHMPIGSKGAYIFDTYIKPEFRGRALYPVLISTLQSRLIKQGVELFYCHVDAVNMRSIRAHEKIGVKWIETITFIRLTGLRIHIARPYSKKRYGSISRSRERFESRVIT